jgi:hypothetical protein
MPLMPCQKDSKPGWKFGESGFCYTYIPNNKQSEVTARLKAAKQGAAQHIKENK